MNIQASGHSFLIIAAALVLGLAGAGPSQAADTAATDRPVQIAASDDSVFPNPNITVNAAPAAETAAPVADAAAGGASAAGETVAAAAPAADETVNVVSLSNDDSSGWDKASLIGKIFIACGTLLTLGSAARMFMV